MFGQAFRPGRNAVDPAASPRAAVDRFNDEAAVDLRMPGVDGVRFLEVLRTRGEDVPVLMISGYGTVDAAVESLHLGADDFLTKPVDPDVLSAGWRSWSGGPRRTAWPRAR